MSSKPTIGMIVPPRAGLVPPECSALYGDRADFLVEGLGLDSLTPDGYDSVIDAVAGKARRLAARGADAVVLMGTSLSFYRGEAENARLADSLRSATGLPATTMSYAVLDAFKAVSCNRLALGTAYVDSVNERLCSFLEEHDVEIAGLVAMKLEAVDAIHQVTGDSLLELGRKAFAAGPDAEGIFISCGGLRTLETTARLESETGKPVVSSSVAGAWACMRLLGLNPGIPGYGMLLESRAQP